MEWSVWAKIGWVALGGALGALCRTGAAEFIASRVDRAALGTLAVNLAGCLLMGSLKAAVKHIDWGGPETRALVFSGFLGAFTTFSTFEADTVELWQGGARIFAVGYVGASVVGGVAMFALGWAITSALLAQGGE
ncbi:MAG: fluoride efflux transporter CrcB [Myxococcota bacterium]